MPYYILILIACMVCTGSADAAKSFTFKEALTLAYRYNPELQAEIERAKAMHGIFIQSGLYPNPQITLTAEDFGGSGLYKAYEAAETTFSVTQPIPLGNRLSYLKKATYGDYLTSLAQINVQKANLYSKVGVAYVDALYAGQWHEVTEKLIKLNQTIVEEITKRVQAGIGTQLDLRLAQVRLGEARIQEKKAVQEMLSLRAQLARLLGNGTQVNGQLIDEGLPDVPLKWPFLLKNMAHSPQLIQMKFQLKAKRATITAVKRAVWPDLNIQAGARHFSDDGSNAAVLSAFAQAPVFDRNQGKILTAEAQYTQTTHELQGVRLELRQNLYMLLLQARQSLYEVDLVSQSLLPLARQSIKQAQEGYRMGRYTYLELTLALTTLYDEERHYQQAHADYHKALIQLTALLGLKPQQGNR
ncbi:MAG: cobalt transporter [Legionella sp. 40-6]|nr:TolC family protein [Legionella sp.]OJY33918.1 MAG: cobalt transporter [Legionella sp. 40-6]